MDRLTYTELQPEEWLFVIPWSLSCSTAGELVLSLRLSRKSWMKQLQSQYLLPMIFFLGSVRGEEYSFLD